eukprot:333124_1
MANQQHKPSYSGDLSDDHGIKMISERIARTGRTMKHLRDFFQDSANMSFINAQTLHKLQMMNIGQSEFGTLKFIIDRYSELIETSSKNAEILGSKIRTPCYQKLSDEINRISNQNTKLLSDLQQWQKSMDKEEKKLSSAKWWYNPESEKYIQAVSVCDEFRLKYNAARSKVLDELEQTEYDRAQMLHRILKLYVEIHEVSLTQSLQNVGTIKGHIANIDANADNVIFVKKHRMIPEIQTDKKANDNAIANVEQQTEKKEEAKKQPAIDDITDIYKRYEELQNEMLNKIAIIEKYETELKQKNDIIDKDKTNASLQANEKQKIQNQLDEMTQVNKTRILAVQKENQMLRNNRDEMQQMNLKQQTQINQLKNQLKSIQNELDETRQANLRQRKTILELQNLNEEEQKMDNKQKHLNLSKILTDLRKEIEIFEQNYNKKKK